MIYRKSPTSWVLISDSQRESVYGKTMAGVLVPNELEFNKVVASLTKTPTFYEPVWCDKCDQSWYKWRLWLYEVLEITPWVKEMILDNQSAFNINRMAIKEWMISLEQDGIMKALNGDTSLEEVYAAAKSQNED